MPGDKTHVSITRDDLKDLVEGAISGAFIKMGISTDNPLEMQKDMAFIRSLRVGSETIKVHGIIAGIGILLSAIVTCVWLGFKVALASHK